MARPSFLRDFVLFLALLATALALGPALAHLFELPNKISLAREQYFTVQAIYAGWSLIAIVLAVQLLSIAGVMFVYRHHTRVFAPALAALVCLLAAQAVFWIYTYPANVATENWTRIPENWELLRRHWEYSHAAGAGFQLLAMIALIIAALARGRITG